MATHIKIKADRGTETQFFGVFDDHTLCGLSTSGDEEFGIIIKGRVSRKVNCDDCISIVKYSKVIDEKEFVKKITS